MSQDIRFLGRVIDYNPIKQTVEIQIDFLTPEQQEVVENLLKDKSEFSFWFNKPFRMSKTNAQLKKYYLDLKNILIKLDVVPTSENIKAFDLEIKKSAFPTQMLEVFDRKIPLIPSKANMTVDELSYMIQYLQEHYIEPLDVY